MRILKPGEPCPCCGTPIRDDLPRWKLLLLSYIAEGLSLMDAINVLAEVMEVPPPLDGVEAPEEVTVPDPRPDVQGETPRALRDRDVGPLGRNAAEKRAIMDRLRAYREEHGLGCWTAVVKAGGGKLTDDLLRGMAAGTVVVPVTQWRLAARALDKLEAGCG